MSLCPLIPTFYGWLRRLVWGMCLFYGAGTFAQTDIVPDKHFDRYSGLSVRTLYTICNDPDGFIWLGSDNGVFCFDGKTFYHYSTADGLCDNEILAMYSDSRGRIWCAGYNGKISVIENGVVDTQSPFIRNKPNKGFIIDFAEDSLGNVYLVSESQYLFRISHEGELRYWSLRGDIHRVWRMIISRNRLFLEGDGRLAYWFNPVQDTLLPFHSTRVNGREKQPIHAAREYDAMWEIDTETGIYRDLLSDKKIYLPLSPKDYLRYVSQPDARWVVLSVFPMGVMAYDLGTHTCRKIKLPGNAMVPETAWDAQDNLWMITPHDGLYAFHSGHNSASVKPIPGFGTNIVGACMFNGEVVAATGMGRWIVDNGTGADTVNPIGNELIKAPIETINFFNVGDSLYGVYGSFGRIAYKSGKTTNHSRGNKDALFYKDSTWVIRNHNAILILRGNQEQKIFEGRTYTICIQDDILWFSTFLGLYRYNLRTGSLYEKTFLLPNDGRIERIAAVGNHMQILCSNNSGVWLLWEGRTLLGKISVENGLHDNDCRELDAYSKGWIVRHAMGMSKIERNSLEIQTVSEWRGLPMSSVNSIAIYGDSVLLASTQGLYRAGVEELFGEQAERRDVKFMQIHSKGKPLLPNGIQLQPGGNHLRIDFAIPEYDHPERVQYQWRINEEPWNKTFNTSLEFADLSSGNYAFQVKARTPGSSWTKTSVLKFEVITPFWENTWFLVAVGLALLMLGWGVQRWIYRRGLAREREKASVRYQLMDFEQKALNAMMNPHFVFNAMGSIQHLLNTGNNQQANDYLVKFSRLIRKSLETSQLEFCYLDDEIERLTLYLQLEKMRFGGRMDFVIDVADDVDAEQVKIPTMILQTYVENAIIHGAAALRGEAWVRLSFSRQGSGLAAGIEDNGPGFDVNNKAKRSVRFGVSATEKRLELLTQITGKPYSVNIVSPVSAEGGTRVELLFSVKE